MRAQIAGAFALGFAAGALTLGIAVWHGRPTETHAAVADRVVERPVERLVERPANRPFHVAMPIEGIEPSSD